MDDNQFKELVLRKLDKIEEKHEKAEEKHESRHEKLQAAVMEVREEQLRNSIILSQVERDIPEIKKDLFEHKEGVIQNRTAIQALQSTVTDQDVIINKAVSQYTEEVKPVVEHVKSMQELPTKIKDFIISASKIMAALVTILGSAGAIIAYFMGWFGK